MFNRFLGRRRSVGFARRYRVCICLGWLAWNGQERVCILRVEQVCLELWNHFVAEGAVVHAGQSPPVRPPPDVVQNDSPIPEWLLLILAPFRM